MLESKTAAQNKAASFFLLNGSLRFLFTVNSKAYNILILKDKIQ